MFNIKQLGLLGDRNVMQFRKLAAQRREYTYWLKLQAECVRRGLPN